MHEADFCIIQGDFNHEGKTESIYCGIQRNKRKVFKRNQKEYPKLSEHIGLIPLVMISPSDNSLIMDGGEERRKFMNGVISQYDKAYLHNIIRYNRSLTQRNKHLKSIAEQNDPNMDMLHSYNDQLIRYGQAIFEKRKQFVEDLIPVFSEFYQYISDNREDVSLVYDSQLLRKPLDQLLEDSLHKDRVLQYTTAGIHRDDLTMELSGFPLKKVGSQGQQKTFQVALKLGKFEFIKKVSGKAPILLMDDIFDKFDVHRVEKIIRLVSENGFGQIFITDTHEDRMQEVIRRINIDHKIFRISPKQQISEVS